MALGGKPNSSVKTAHGTSAVPVPKTGSASSSVMRKGEQQGIALAHEEKADKKL